MLNLFKRKRTQPKSTNWANIIAEISPHVESHQIYVEFSDGSRKLYSPSEDVTGLESIAVVYSSPHAEPWETEVPAKYMADKLSVILNRHLQISLSRDPDSFVGYFVEIRGTERKISDDA